MEKIIIPQVEIPERGLYDIFQDMMRPYLQVNTPKRTDMFANKHDNCKKENSNDRATR